MQNMTKMSKITRANIQKRTRINETTYCRLDNLVEGLWVHTNADDIVLAHCNCGN